MKVDVCMPFWGDPDHFKEAVNSIVGQSDPDWRLLILDDVYPDTGPGEWVQGLADARITYLRNDQNLGPSRNYSKAVSLVDGDFVVIMGCDDRMLPGYLARVRELLERFPQAGIVQPGVRVIDEHGAESLPIGDRVKRRLMPRGTGAREFSGEAALASLLHGNWTYFPSLVWRREFVAGGFRADLDVVQDLAKLTEILVGGGSLVLDDEVVFEYRRHSGSVSARTTIDGSKYAQERVLFAEAAATARSLGWKRAARAAAWHWSSRLSALSAVPAAMWARHWAGTRALLRHVFGPSRDRRQRD